MHALAACACDLRGVIDNGDCARTASNTSQPGDCNCKANVVGSDCSECRQGYFNLSAANQDGCQGEIYVLELLAGKIMQKQNLVPWAKNGPLTLTNHQKVFNEAHVLNTSL